MLDPVLDSSFLKRKSQVFLTYPRSNGGPTGDSVAGKKGFTGGDRWRPLSCSKERGNLLCWWLGFRGHSSGGWSFAWVKAGGLWNRRPGDCYSVASQQRPQRSWLQPGYWNGLFPRPFPHFSDKRPETRRLSPLTEDGTCGWHHRPSGHESEQMPGGSEGQGRLARCSPWGCKELDRRHTA